MTRRSEWFTLSFPTASKLQPAAGVASAGGGEAPPGPRSRGMRPSPGTKGCVGCERKSGHAPPGCPGKMVAVACPHDRTASYMHMYAISTRGGGHDERRLLFRVPGLGAVEPKLKSN
jgi:hypothetical protein